PASMSYRKMPVLVCKLLELGSIAFSMCAIKVKPATNPIMITLILTAVPAFIPRHAMQYFNFDSREKVRHPVAGHEGRVRFVFHHLLHGFQVSLIRSERVSSTPRDKPRGLMATTPDLLLKGPEN